MQTLQEQLAQSKQPAINGIAAFLQQHINAHWQTTFDACHAELIEKFPQIGDSVYGIYGNYLFKPAYRQIKEAGFRITPKLPGNFMISREWGEETDRQRWMWSKVTTAEGTPIGTLVIVFYHDHETIRIPRAFDVIALEATSKPDVIRALSQRSPEFAAAREAKIEIAEYLASLEEQSPS
jgi:hypothetical protein